MKRHLYSVYDRKSGKFGSPFIMENHDTAKRSFFDSLVDVINPTLLANFPEDYDLYFIGTFDTDTGFLEPIKPEFIACSATFGNLQTERERRMNAYFNSEKIEQIVARRVGVVENLLSRSEKTEASHYQTVLESIDHLKDRCGTLEGAVFNNLFAEVSENGKE